MDRVPMTARGAELLRAELARLKQTDRPAVIQAIAEARAHGDLRENFEYKAARDQQGFIEGRIKAIEGKLAHAEVIRISAEAAGGRVVFGATVRVADAEAGSEQRYRIVGEDEADVEAGMISVHSPIARALIGKEAGEQAVVQAPGGERELEVVSVEYEESA